jgi:pyruvate dehydrogenase complex dihydrolipoamide acetyltransferase long form
LSCITGRKIAKFAHKNHKICTFHNHLLFFLMTRLPFFGKRNLFFLQTTLMFSLPNNLIIVVYFFRCILLLNPVIVMSLVSRMRIPIRMFANATKITMPALSPTMAQGNLVKWRKNVGDRIRPGDVLAEIETDKATLEFEAQEDGWIAKIFVSEGTDAVPVGRVLGLMVDEQKDIATVQDTPSPDASTTSAASAAPSAPSASASSASGTPRGGADTLSMEASLDHAALDVSAKLASGSSRLAPAARFILASAGIDPRSVVGTGKHGTIVKEDALRAVASHASIDKMAQEAARKITSAQPQSLSTPSTATSSPSSKPTSLAGAAVSSSATEFSDVKTTNIRRIIAERLLESKRNHPHAYVSTRVNVASVNALRTAAGKTFSVNDVFISAAAKAIPRTAGLAETALAGNAAGSGVDISIAVATDKGLLTPVVRGAESKSFNEIASTVKDLATRGRAGQLKPQEMSGGVFSISNLGMFGIDVFAAVINPPQVGILAVSQAVPDTVSGPILMPLVEPLDGDSSSSSSTSSSSSSSDKHVAGSWLTVQLSYDAARITEEQAASFLANFKRYVENPAAMLL